MMPHIPKRAVALPVLFLLIFVACQARRVPKYTRAHFTNCISGDSSGLGARLDLHGFYQYFWYHHTTYGYGKTAVTVDSLKRRILFYADGSYVTDFNVLSPSGGSSSDGTPPVVDSARYLYYTWGRYRLSGDTIICQWLYPATTWGIGVGGWEKRYRIVGPREIELLPATKRPLYRMSRSERLAFDEEARNERYSTGKFIYLQHVPRVNSWLNTQNWIHCK